MGFPVPKPAAVKWYRSAMTENVFARIHAANAAGNGITLSPADVELIMDLCGEAMAKADAAWEEWRERLEDYDRATRRLRQTDG